MVAPALRFLVADPLDGVQVFVRRLLEGYGFDPQRIHCCAGSNEALQLGLAQAPDFLLTDWFGGASPTGLQLVEQLRARNRELRVGFLSFQVTPEIEAAAAGVGSRFLLKKPFDAADLKREIQRGFEYLAATQPETMARVNRETQGRLDPRQRRIELPPLPAPLRVGESVRWDGKPYQVTAVVMRGGEQLAQLSGAASLVPSHKLQRSA